MKRAIATDLILWVSAALLLPVLAVNAATAQSTSSSTALAATPGAATEHTPKPSFPALDISIPEPPVAFRSEGKWHLCYELHVANMSKSKYEFKGLDVIQSTEPNSGTGTKPFSTFAEKDLQVMLYRPGRPKGQSNDRSTDQRSPQLGPGEYGVIYVWITSDTLEEIPAALQHTVKVKIGDYPEALSLTTDPVKVDKRPVVVVRSPLEGDSYVAGNGPSNTSAHRRALIPVNGHAYISQRYAIDWVQINPDGNTYQGDSKDNKSYRIYGKEIHSVADGVVAETKDGLPQNTPNAEKMAIPITLETIGGNHVIVDIGGGRFAFYAHMQPGSVRVKVGDKVKAGDVLGLVGNTGNSSEPHLHFDICDASSMLACEGLPYALPSYELTGKAIDSGTSAVKTPAVKVTTELPSEDQIVNLSLKP